MTKDFDWTPEAVRKLTALHAQGLSTARIARLLGVATRNAVIGKLCRLGLKGPRKVVTGHKAVRKKVAVLKPKAPLSAERPAGQWKGPRSNIKSKSLASAAVAKTADPVKFEPRNAPSAHDPKTLLELRAGDCRWPIGDPRDPAFRFCGGHALDGRPYCLPHELFSVSGGQHHG